MTNINIIYEMNLIILYLIKALFDLKYSIIVIKLFKFTEASQIVE